MVVIRKLKIMVCLVAAATMPIHLQTCHNQVQKVIFANQVLLFNICLRPVLASNVISFSVMSIPCSLLALN